MATWAIIGLGNPGQQYLLNRHNVGFMVLDVVQALFGAPQFKIKNNVALSKISIISGVDGSIDELILVKPQTFMNLSGTGVLPILSFYKIPLHQVLVFHDDLDLEPGTIKVKRGGGSAGHNGLKSLDAIIGANYWRVRIGIGRPFYKDAVSSYVLSNFSAQEIEDWVTNTLHDLAKNIDSLLKKNQ